jgi:hypothetical protein
MPAHLSAPESLPTGDGRHARTGPTLGWMRLLALTDATSGQVDACADVLEIPEVVRWLGPPAAALARRAASDRARTSYHLLVLVAGEPVGWVGWLAYRARPGWLETTTYLAPDLWGSGVNAELKQLAWQSADAAGRQLVASVHIDNHRSMAAMARLWPEAVSQVRFEAHKPRTARVFHLDTPPEAGFSWPAGTVAVHADVLRRLEDDGG